MHRLILLVALAGALGSSCQRKYLGALDVKVTVGPKLVADCLRVSVLDGTTELRWTTFPRVAGQTDYEVGVDHVTGFPATINLVASAWVGTCSDESSLKLNSRGSPVAATFPATGIDSVQVAVDVPDATLDTDRDGYAGGTGGADCNDHDKTIFPGSVQLCNVNADTDCDGLIACADPDCFKSPDCANPPNTLVLDGLPLSQLRYDCMGPFSVSLDNTTGPRTATLPVTLGLAASSPVQFFPAAGCTDGTAITSATIPFMKGDVQLWASFASVGLTTLTVSAAGFTSATKNVDVIPQVVNSVKLVGLPATLPANTCSGAVTVALLDSAGRPTVTSGGLTIGLQASPSDATGNFFSTPDCTGTPLTGLVVPAGQTGAQVYFVGQRALTVSVTATASGTISVMGSVLVTAGAATHLAFTNAPLSLRTTDQCSLVPVTVQSQDDHGNQAPVPADTTLTLSSELPSLTFYPAGGNCDGPAITSATLPQGASELSFSVKATSATPSSGSITVLPLSTLTGMATQVISVSSGPPTQIKLSGATQVFTAGDCSPTEITLQILDGSNVQSAYPGPSTVTLSTTGTGVTFYGQPGCTGPQLTMPSFTLPAGVSQQRMFFTSTKAQTLSFSVTTHSFTPSTSSGHSIGAAAPQSLTWSPTLGTAVAGACSTSFTLSVFDQFGNPASFKTPAALSFTPGTLTFDTAAGACSKASGLLYPAGAASVSVQASSTVAGDYPMQATAGGVSTVTAATLTVKAAPPTFAVSPAAATVTAGVCTQLSFTDKDTYNNVVNGTLTFPSVPAGMGVFTDLSCTAAYSSGTTTGGAMTLYFKSLKASAAPVNLTASLATASNGTLSVSTAVTTNPAAAAVNIPGANPLSVVAGACTGITVRSFDTFANPVDGTVTFPSLPANFAVYSNAGCTTAYIPVSTASGVLPVYFSSTSANATGVTFTASVAAVSGSITVKTTPAAAIAVLNPAAFPNVSAGACTAVTFTNKDTYGNPIDGTFAIGASAGTFTFFSEGSCSTALGSPATAGGTLALWFKSTKAGAATLTAGVGASTTTAAVTTVPGLVTLSVAAMTVTPNADDCDNLTYTSQDMYGNAVDGAFTFAALPAGYTAYTNNCAGPLGSPSSSGGSITVGVKSTLQGPATVTGSIGSNSRNITLTTNPVAAFTSYFTPATYAVTAGVCTAFTFNNKDVHGNFVDGAVTMSGSPGISFWTDSGCSTTPFLTPSTSSGVISGFFKSTTVPGGTISGAAAGHSGSASVTTVADTALVTVDKPSVTVMATHCTALTFTSKDQFNNVVSGTLSFTSIPSGFSVWSNNLCNAGLGTPGTDASGNVTAYFKSTTAGTGAALTGKIGAVSATSTVTTTADTATASLSVAPTTLSLTAGVCNPTAVIFTSKDASNNPIDGPFTFSALPAGVTAYGDSGCGSAIAAGTTGGLFTAYFKSTQAVPATVQGNVGTTNASVALTTTATTESKLVFTSPASGGTVAAGGCSGAITVQLQDQYGNPVSKTFPTFPITLGLSGDPGPSFWLNPTCDSGTPAGLSGSSSMTFYFKPTVGPATLTLTASGAVTSATQSWTTTAAPATKLGFKSGSTPPATLARFVCSSAIVVQTQTSGGVATNASSTVNVNLSSLTPGAALAFYNEGTCTSAPITTTSITSGTSDSPQLFVMATGGASTTVSAADASATLTAASQAVSTTGASEKIVLSSVGTDVEAGGCVTVTATRTLSNGTTPITKGTSTITASSSDTTVNLFQSSDCSTTALTSLAILPGTSAVTFYAHGNSTSSGAPLPTQTLTASESNGGLSSGTLTVKSYPLVRRGNCTSNSTSMDCTLDPPLPSGNDVTRTMLFFQATTGGQLTGANALVQCELASTPGSVHCIRGGGAGTMNVQWQTVSWGRNYGAGGVSVQHLAPQAFPAVTPANVPITPVADMTKSFVLASSASDRTSTTSSADFFTAQLSSTSNVIIDSSQDLPDAGTALALQVVQMRGAQVERGVQAGAGPVKSVFGTFPGSPDTTLLSPLFTVQTAADTGACKLGFRGSMSGATLTASRGNTVATACSPNGIDRFSWAIIQWPTGTIVTSVDLSMTDTAPSSTGTLAGYVPDRTLLYAAAQGPGGQSSGESETNNGEVDYGRARFTCSGTTLTATRGKAGASTGTTKFTVWAVTFKP